MNFVQADDHPPSKTFAILNWENLESGFIEGVQRAICVGDPNQRGLYVVRLKFPENCIIPPHTHPRPEVVTVWSGKILIGFGEKNDMSSRCVQSIGRGDFFTIPENRAHYAYTPEETILLLMAEGPWKADFIRP